MASLAELAVQGIVAAGGGGALVAGVNAVFSRRQTRAAVELTRVETGKTSAEIAEVGASTAAAQVDTAMDMLREVRSDMAAAREDIKALRAEIASLQAWKTRHELRLDAHVRWDEQVRLVLAERGVEIGPPPPLRDNP